MVIYGVSRACATCKRRRKKCDEVRPACGLCKKSGMICPGYQDDSVLYWRQYRVPSHSPRNMGLYANSLPASPRSYNFQPHDILGFFLSDFVVEFTSRSISRGLLHNFQSLLNQVQPASNLHQAAGIVALASIAVRTKRPPLMRLASQRYGQLLLSFRKTLSEGTSVSVIELLTTAVLLDLYEIVSSNESSNARQITHTNAVAAILSNTLPPPVLSSGLENFQLLNSLLLEGPLMYTKAPNILCIPSSSDPIQKLDNILIQCHSFFKRADQTLASTIHDPNDLRELQTDAKILNERFSQWASNMRHDWLPCQVGTILEDSMHSSCSYAWPGVVYEFADLYIATVWNNWRKTYILLLDIMLRCALLLSDHLAISAIQQQAQILASDIASSVPFHLARNVRQYIESHSTGHYKINPNKTIGGLLLMHPLYVAAKCSSTPRELRSYFRRCLCWIGTNMGIGQATLLAEACVETVEEEMFGQQKMVAPSQFQHTDEGHVIMWSGMLLKYIT